MTSAGAEITRSEVRMPEGAFHSTGEYDVNIHLHTDVDTQIKVIVEAA